MLRMFVLALILANGAYFAWSEGLLRAYGYAPNELGEPLRLQQQLHPENIRILSAAEFKKVETQVQSELAPKECLQSAPLDATQVAAVRGALDGLLDAQDWSIDSLTLPARWIIYMGKFPSPEALEKKRGEIAALNLKMEPLGNPSLEPGLSLGGFDTEEAAQAGLERMSQRGIRTARVVKVRTEGRAEVLKVPAATEAIISRLSEVKAAWGGRALKPCSAH